MPREGVTRASRVSAVALTLVCVGLKPSASRASAPKPSVDASVTDEPQAVPSGSAPSGYPVKWSDQLGLAALVDIEKQLRNVDATAFGELELGGKRILPRSCVEWSRLHAAGYAPSTAVEVQPDGGARRRCETLTLLSQAKPARQSFTRKLIFDKSILAILPADLATRGSPDHDRDIALATENKRSLADFDPKAKVKRSVLPGVLEITEGGRQSSIAVEPMAWADFDGDGTDDVVVSVVNSMAHGSISNTRVIALTRSSNGEVLRLLALDKTASRPLPDAAVAGRPARE